MSKWIEFRLWERPADRKTDIYDIWTKDGHHFLGRISWYAPWRCYSFYPSGRNSVFERQCLQDIVNFLEQLMEQRKQQKQKANDDARTT